MKPDVLEALNLYEETADQLISISDKSAVARAARVLALYVGHYQRRYGPISPAALAGPDVTLQTPEQIADRVEAMRVLAAALVVSAVASADVEDEQA